MKRAQDRGQKKRSKIDKIINDKNEEKTEIIDRRIERIIFKKV